MTVYYDTSENFHPFECDGHGQCCHCDRQMVFKGEGPERHHAIDTLEDATWEIVHDPATCALCDPAYDGGPAYEAITTPRPSLRS